MVSIIYINNIKLHNRATNDGYNESILKILKDNVHFFINFEVSDEDSDCKRATDIVMVNGGNSFGCRVLKEKHFYNYHHFTISTSTKNCCKSELDKVLEGFPRYYFFGWGNENTKEIPFWVIIDMNIFRKTAINNPDVVNKMNDFGDTFNGYKIRDLNDSDCIITKSDSVSDYLNFETVINPRSQSTLFDGF